MKNLKWLIKRELWEHKDGFIWAPAILSAMFILMMAAWTFSKLVMGNKAGIYVNGESINAAALMASSAQRESAFALLGTGNLLVCVMLFSLTGFVTFFYCLGSLFDERDDRGILFWKSLPVSDAESVVSKALVALVIAPSISIGLACFTVAVLIILGSFAFAGDGGIKLTWELITHGFASAPYKLVALLPIQIIWALPTVGWLLMVSSMVKSKPIIWAVGLPLIAMLTTTMVMISISNQDSASGAAEIVVRLLSGTTPGAWTIYGNVEQNSATSLAGSLKSSWEVITEQGAVSGALAGCVMIYASIFMRRRAGAI